MHNLIRFFQKHHLLFLFIFLEGIGVFMLVRNNYIQRIVFAEVTNAMSGGIHEQISKWHDYLHLKEENQQLLQENERLRNMLPDAYYMSDTTRIVRTDSLNFKRFAYLPAQVINSTVNKQYNYITLDRGTKQGVDEDMAVIGPEGIVGIVYSASDHFSTVIPVVNRNFKVSTKFKKNNFYGSLAWDGRSYRHAILNEIPLHAPVELGDSLVVTGYSSSFPAGIPVGVVDKIEQKDGSFYTIGVLLATDFRKLHYVTVVEDLMKTEQKRLEQKNMEAQ